MKTTKKILSLTLVAFIILSLTAVAFADGLIITSASNSISKSGSTITMGQTTYTSPNATRIKHVKYLQRNVGGAWQTYATITTNRYNSNSFIDYASRGVASGYSYRLVTYHYAYEGTTLKDYEVRTSASVYVG